MNAGTLDDPTPLTPARKALAERNRDLADRVARIASRPQAWRRETEQARSAAYLGLCMAARSWPGDDIDDLGFRTYAFSRVRGAIKDARQEFDPLGYRRKARDGRPSTCGLGLAYREFPGFDASGEGPPEAGAEYADWIRSLASGLPHRHARVIRDLYTRAGLTREALAREMGVVESRVTQIHTEAIDLIRERLGVPRGTPHVRLTAGRICTRRRRAASA